MAFKKAGPARFVTRYTNWYSLVVSPQKLIAHPDGAREIVPGKRIEFNRGEYITEDPKEIEFLRKHNAFGRDFTEDTSLKPAEDAE